MSVKSNARVLIAEDSLAVAKRLENCLKQTGYHVEIARNGRDALTLAQRKKFDLIITDEQMPIMSGRDLCRALRDDERYQNVPIIFLTGAPFGEDEADQELRITAVFGKPFVPASVVRAAENELTASRRPQGSTKPSRARA